MSTSEIAKLESRWRENPSGLTFAPLAEAYRKQKDPQRALEILAPGLEKHPDYIPANIVLGRCHWDLNDLPNSERAFSHVLSLDGENVIALKALADINERLMNEIEAEIAGVVREVSVEDAQPVEFGQVLFRVDPNG